MSFQVNEACISHRRLTRMQSGSVSSRIDMGSEEEKKKTEVELLTHW